MAISRDQSIPCTPGGPSGGRVGARSMCAGRRWRWRTLCVRVLCSSDLGQPRRSSSMACSRAARRNRSGRAAGVAAQGANEVVDLPGAGAGDVSGHDHRPQRLVDPPAGIEQLGEERPRPQLRDPHLEIGLGRAVVRPVAGVAGGLADHVDEDPADVDRSGPERRHTEASPGTPSPAGAEPPDTRCWPGREPGDLCGCDRGKERRDVLCGFAVVADRQLPTCTTGSASRSPPPAGRRSGGDRRGGGFARHRGCPPGRRAACGRCRSRRSRRRAGSSR